MLDAFNVSADDLENQQVDVSMPATVPGRVAHIDGDFILYQCSSETKAELDPHDPTPRRPLVLMGRQAVDIMEYLRDKAGAEDYVVHFTDRKGTKGLRAHEAILKPYQGNRANAEKPEKFEDLFKVLLELDADVRVHAGCEADDALCEAVYHDPKNAVLCSKDKDLLMVPGMRLDMNTYELDTVSDEFGYIEMSTKTKTKKVIGRGTKFFWAQMLMGDTADNIQGLPMWICPETKKATRCGPVKALELLGPCKTDLECFTLVYKAWKRLGETDYELKHYYTGEQKTATQCLLADARLLWMRRSKNDRKDFDKWLKEILN